MSALVAIGAIIPAEREQMSVTPICSPDSARSSRVCIDGLACVEPCVCSIMPDHVRLSLAGPVVRSVPTIGGRAGDMAQFVEGGR